MKKLFNTLLAFTLFVILWMSCKKEYIPHYTWYLPKDSLVFNEATYIENDSSFVFFELDSKWVDTLVCDVHSTMGFFDEFGRRTEVTYLGGYNSTVNPWIRPAYSIALMENGLDHDDTIYFSVPVEVNYGIIQIKKDNYTKIDTIQYFNTEGSLLQWNVEWEYPEYFYTPTYPALAFDYLQEFSGTLWDKQYYRDKVIDYGITYKAIFFMDMFPYYETNQDSLKILYCSDGVIVYD